MRTVGIETATRVGSVGLVENGRVLGELSGQTSGHGETLPPLLRKLLDERGWSTDSLDAVAVSIGPGSFTGLRVGLGLAKGLAFAAAVPVVAVPTLDALAAVAQAEPGERVCPILDARKGELYAGWYRVSASGELEKELGPGIVSVEELLEEASGRCRFLGDGAEIHGDRIEAALGSAAIILPFSHYRPSGGAVAQQGAEKVRAGAGMDPAALGALEPLYVRPSYAEQSLTGGSGGAGGSSRHTR